MMMATNDCLFLCYQTDPKLLRELLTTASAARLTFLASGARWSNKIYDAYAVSDVLELLGPRKCF